MVASTLGSRNVVGLKAVMIASGGLSGGISSSIAGGSFWSGVREGIITSGLNHLMNHFANSIQQKSELKEILKENDIDPDGVPEYKVSEAIKVAEALPDRLYQRSGRIKIQLKDIQGENGHANRTDYYDPNTKKFSSTKANYVNLSKSAFKSYLQLASTLGHELTHIIDINNGNVLKWLNMGGKKNGVNFASDLMELNAHEWQIKYSAPVNMERYKGIYKKIHGYD